MVQKGSEREAKRRKEAQENGVILEKARKPEGKGGRGGGGAARGGRRDGVDGPSVGRFSNGMLTLSKNDVKSIEGRKGGGGGKKRGKR